MHATRILLLVLLLLQKQPPTDKQGSQEQIQKPATNQPVPDARQQKPEAIVTQARPVESQASAEIHKEQDRAQTVKELNDTLLVVFTGLLVAVGVLQWLTFRQHEKWMGKNVDVVQKIADAADANIKTAEASTNTLKNINRAWVLFNWNQRPMSTAEQFEISVINWGPTPARIEFSFFGWKILTKEELANLPVPPIYGPSGNLDGRMLAPKEPITIESGDAKRSAENDWQYIYNGAKVFVWYGVVKYRDILDASVLHETAFCHWYSSKRTGLHIGGPTEYNKAT
jgi:hypothetical protein